MLDPKKCRLLQRSVTLLGPAVSSDGMTVTEDCTKHVRTWSTPTNLTDLLTFLQLANCSRCFVEGFAKTTNPLHKLAQKQARENFKWEKNHDEALKELKRKLCSVLILMLPNIEAGVPSFILDTNADDVTVDGVLSQRQRR